MLLKYSPQESELLEGVAFYGRAGQAILKSLQRLRVDPMAVYGTNCLKFAGAEPDARADEWLTRELHIVQPKLVVVMGEHALEFLNRLEFPLSRPLEPAAGELRRVHADRRGALHAGRRRVARRAGCEDGLLERLQVARRLVGGAARRIDAFARVVIGRRPRRPRRLLLRLVELALERLDVVGRGLALARARPGRLRVRLPGAAAAAPGTGRCPSASRSSSSRGGSRRRAWTRSRTSPSSRPRRCSGSGSSACSRRSASSSSSPA